MAIKNNFMKFKNNKEKGVVFVDALIAIAIIAIAFVALLGVSEASVKLSALLHKKTDALLLAQEQIEAVRSLRDGTDWSTNGLGFFTTGSSYYAFLNTGSSPATWQLNAGEETTGIFTKKIVINRVSRDPSTNDIQATYNPVNDDDDTRKITVTVEWEGTSVQLVTFFTNWR